MHSGIHDKGALASALADRQRLFEHFVLTAFRSSESQILNRNGRNMIRHALAGALTDIVPAAERRAMSIFEKKDDSTEDGNCQPSDQGEEDRIRHLLALSRQFNRLVMRQRKPVRVEPQEDLDETDKSILISLLM